MSYIISFGRFESPTPDPVRIPPVPQNRGDSYMSRFSLAYLPYMVNYNLVPGSYSGFSKGYLFEFSACFGEFGMMDSWNRSKRSQ